MRSANRSPIIHLRILALALAVSALAALAACGYGSPGHVEVGSGNVISQTRTVDDFTEVQAGGGIQVQLASGPRQVVVTAQPDIADITKTEVTGSRLTVETTSGFVSPDGIVVRVSTPRVTAIDLSGGASASGTVGKAGNLTVRLSGGAHATVSGSASAIDLQASGGAIATLGDLRATKATVDLSGGVLATLNVTASVTGSASGGVVLTLARTPARTSVETSGGALVRTPE